VFSFIIILILILILLRVPIVFSIGIGSLFYCLMSGIDTVILAQRLVDSLNQFTFIAIPFFLLAGELMNIGGITQRILNLSRSLVGYIKGGLGHVNVVASMIFAGLSGSAIADAAGLGAIEIEMMNKANYDKNFSAAITLASSTIGPIIPPSITLIIYAMVSNTSVGRLLMAGLVPGIIMGISLMVMVYYISKKKNYPTDPWPGFKKIFYDFNRAIIPLFTPIIIVGGIISGLFSPTEAGLIAAVYAFLLGKFYYKKLKWSDFKDILLDTAMTTANIGFIIGVSGIFSWIITIEGVPQALASFIFSITSNKYVILLMLNVVVLILGCFIDAGPLIILLVPILVPLLNIAQIDLIHFGVVITINAIIGTITPPVGTCLYAVSGVSKLPIETIAIKTLPFLIMLIIALLIITYFPAITLYLPNLIFG
jgi:tripartite ATP-independent transporter DctM subunit